VQHAFEEVERELAKVGKQLKRKVVLPLASGYRPKSDASPEFDENQVTFFASLMEVLCWCIKLGWINILLRSICWLTSRHVPEKDTWSRFV
jgi:hypothetical protein